MSDFYAGVLVGAFGVLAIPPLALMIGAGVYWTVERVRTRKAVRDVIEDSRRWCDEGAREEAA